MSNYQHERGWLDSEVWGNTPYDERGAWSWIIGETEWKDTTKYVNGRPVYLKRGQFTSSLRFMADKWQWDKNKVDRYLKKLKLWSMIEIGTDTGTGQTVITVCNYNKYQSKGKKPGHETGQGRDRGGTATGQTINPSIPSNQREEPPSGAPPPKEYFFEGKVIRLLARDWDRERDKLGLNDDEMERILDGRDEFLAKLPDDDKRRVDWWIPTMKYLESESLGIRRSRP